MKWFTWATRLSIVTVVFIKAFVKVANPVLFAIVAALLVPPTAMPAERLNPSQAVQTGTLNLLLANKNGFVIAADSRRSQIRPFQYWDDSQKFFRIGPQSAAVIAGFASTAVTHSALDMQVAAVLRDEFTEERWSSGQLSIAELPPVLVGRMGDELTILGAMLDSLGHPLDSLEFWMTAAEIRGSRVKLIQLHFEPSIAPFGPLGLRVPQYSPITTTEEMRGFKYVTAGIGDIANQILAGELQSEDPRIIAYYSALRNKTLDDAPLTLLKALAEAILERTEERTPLVGGATQIGVFSSRGKVEWLMPDLPSSKEKLLSKLMYFGSSFSRCGFPPADDLRLKGIKANFQITVSLLQPFDDPFVHVFMGGLIRERSVALDGNIFSDMEFTNVEFRYSGGPFFFENNRINRCSLVVQGNRLPSNPAFRQCVILEEPQESFGEPLGSIVKATPVGCVSRLPDGNVKVKREGKENGRDCKDSRIEIPKVIPPRELSSEVCPQRSDAN